MEHNRKTTIFLHIPKTAGTTFRLLLEKIYGVASEENWDKGITYIYPTGFNYNIWQLIHSCRAYKPELLVGHFSFGVHRLIIGECDYITILRNPIERFLSQYNFSIKNSNNPHHTHFKKYEGWSMEQYLEEPFIENGMTRSLIYREHTIPKEKWIDIAKRNLESFRLVGITEEFDQFVQLASDEFGWEPIEYTNENVSGNKPTATQNQLKLIEKKLELDLELYEFAKKLFHDRL